MTAEAPLICSKPSAPARSCWRIAPTTATQRASSFLYRFRNLVERFFNKLKHFRAVATRFEKHDANYLALVKLAAARIWMRFMSR